MPRFLGIPDRRPPGLLNAAGLAITGPIDYVTGVARAPRATPVRAGSGFRRVDADRVIPVVRVVAACRARTLVDRLVVARIAQAIVDRADRGGREVLVIPFGFHGIPTLCSGRASGKDPSCSLDGEGGERFSLVDHLANESKGSALPWANQISHPLDFRSGFRVRLSPSIHHPSEDSTYGSPALAGTGGSGSEFRWAERRSGRTSIAAIRKATGA